jgi:hypothetical protein
VLSLVCCLFFAACGGSGGDDPVDPEIFPPSVEVHEPAAAMAVTAGDMVTVEYTDSDPDSAATTDLLAISGSEMILIAKGRPELDGVRQSVRWDTTAVRPGSYQILARTSDGTTTVERQAPGMITVRVPPTVQIHEPTGSVLVDRGDVVDIRFTLEDEDSNASASLIIEGNRGRVLRIDGYPEGTHPYPWDTAGLEAGVYQILVVAIDGDHPEVRATRQVTVLTPVPYQQLGGCLLDLETMISGYERLFQAMDGVPSGAIPTFPRLGGFDYVLPNVLAPQRNSPGCSVSGGFSGFLGLARGSSILNRKSLSWDLVCIERLRRLDGGAGSFRFTDIRASNGRAYSYRVETVGQNLFLFGGCNLDFEIRDLSYDGSNYPTGSIQFEATLGADTVTGMVVFDGTPQAQVLLDGDVNPVRFFLDLDSGDVTLP